MKPFNKAITILFIFLFTTACAVQRKPTYQDYSNTGQGSVNFQLFYDELSPYGQWVDYDNYGYVWLPDVRGDFSPYSTNGYWVNTEYGWTWVSNYNWGWAPFHYGRWDYNDYYGWFWVPDTVWGPSWVTWRSGSGYYGWAPMRPGMSIDLRINEGYRDINRWNFVRDRDFGRSNIKNYYIDRTQYTTIINNSTVINNTTVDRRRNTTYVAGPALENVQRDTGRKVNRVSIQDNDRPGEKLNSKELRIYRPQVQQTNNNGQKPAPSRVRDIKEVKSARERNVTSPGTNNRKEQPGEQIQRRRQEIQSPTERQQSQPVQQPQATPVQRQNERKRQTRSQDVEQQPNEKAQPVQPQEQQPQAAPAQQQIERRNPVDRSQGAEQQPNEKSQQVQPAVTPRQQQAEKQQQQKVEKEKQKVERQERRRR